MYTLKEVAERWNKTENDILRMAGNNDLQVWTYIDFYGFYYRKMFDHGKTVDGRHDVIIALEAQKDRGARVMKFGRPTRWVNYSFDEKLQWKSDIWINACNNGGWIKQLARIPCEYLSGLIVNETISTGFFYGETDLQVYMPLEENFMAHQCCIIDIPSSKMRFVSVEKKALCFKVDDITSMEDNHPGLESGGADGVSEISPDTHGSEITAILDPEHPWYSELLAYAVQAWIELYSTRDGRSGDNTYKPSGGHIKMIEDWLTKQNSRLLTPTSIGYLGKVINSSKRGGPNKTQE